jgi:DNA modification methylase
MTDTCWLYCGDALEVLASFPAASVDAVVTDPPAAIAFMGRSWDGDRGGRDRWIAWLAERMQEACRVLKPGGHALVWSLPRTSGWTQMALEDAGFEVRDCIVHIFGSGFAKGRDIYRLDIVPEVERQLREQGVAGEITWR